MSSGTAWPRSSHDSAATETGRTRSPGFQETDGRGLRSSTKAAEGEGQRVEAGHDQDEELVAERQREMLLQTPEDGVQQVRGEADIGRV